MAGEHDTFSSPVRDLRTAADMTQTALAEAMQGRGFRWHQTTVHRIESGQQTLDIAEAAAIADLFAVPLGTLAGVPS
jgi:transcriptional regulator with XRE-family HTH domain